MVTKQKKSVGEKILCQRINRYFFRDEIGRKQKYSQHCIEENCKTESSYNYEGLKKLNFV